MSRSPADEQVRAVHVPTAEDMRALGRAFGRAVTAGDVLLLRGPFGAGKTTFVQGLAQGLGVDEPVTSPSFVLENQYQGRLRMYHVDLFRLERVEPELVESLVEHVDEDGILAIEWPERLPADLLAGAAALSFSHADASGRLVTLERASTHLEDALREDL